MTHQARWALPLAGGLACLLFAAAPARTQQSETVYREFKTDQIEQILQEMKITYQKKPVPGLPDEYDYFFKRNNYNIRFTLSKGKLLWISANFPKTTLEKINGWNQRAKFTRAVLDRNGDKEFAVVESQLDAGGGATIEMVKQMIRRFDQDVALFDQFLRKA